MIYATENPQEAKSICSGYLLIRVDTLRRVHNVGFLAGGLKSCLRSANVIRLKSQNFEKSPDMKV